MTSDIVPINPDCVGAPFVPEELVPIVIIPLEEKLVDPAVSAVPFKYIIFAPPLFVPQTTFVTLL